MIIVRDFYHFMLRFYSGHYARSKTKHDKSLNNRSISTDPELLKCLVIVDALTRIISYPVWFM